MIPLTPCARWTGSRNHSAEFSPGGIETRWLTARPSCDPWPLRRCLPERRLCQRLDFVRAKGQMGKRGRRCRCRPDWVSSPKGRTNSRIRIPLPGAKELTGVGKDRRPGLMRRTVPADFCARLAGIAQGTALPFHGRSRKFESCHPLQIVHCRDRSGSILCRSGRCRRPAAGHALRQARKPGAGMSWRPAL